jgi:hypothetical protein
LAIVPRTSNTDPATIANRIHRVRFDMSLPSVE